MTEKTDAVAQYWATQPPAPSAETILKALHLTGFDNTDQLWWRNDLDGNLRLFIACDDVFAWGAADVEPVADGDIDSLAETIAECETIIGTKSASDAFILWVARKRGERPQAAYYHYIDERLWPLFDAVCQEGDV